MRYLIHDRDPLFSDEFGDILRGAGVKCVKLPARSPDLNAYAERFVLPIKCECLDKLVPLGERHLSIAISEYIQHYHLERNHQGLDNQLITKAATPETPANDESPVVCRERLGGCHVSRLGAAGWTQLPDVTFDTDFCACGLLAAGGRDTLSVVYPNSSVWAAKNDLRARTYNR